MEDAGEPAPAPREVDWRRLCDSPPVYWCRDFLTPEECSTIIHLVQSSAPSSIAAGGQAKLRVDLDPEDQHHASEAAVLRSIERRTAALTGVAPHGGEMPWAVHFTPPPAAAEAEDAPPPAAACPAPAPRAAPAASPAPPRRSAASSPPRRGRRAGSRSVGASRREATASAAPPVAGPAVGTGEPEPGRMTLGLHVDTNNCRERRWVTFIVYLHSTPPACGGHTVFPLALRRGRAAPRGGGKLRNAAALLLASSVHHTGQAGNPYLAEEVRQASCLLLSHADRVARAASAAELAPAGEPWWDPSGMGLAVSPQQGSCVAFFTRTEEVGGAIDPRSWHGGAAVVAGAGAAEEGGGRGGEAGAGGKWTLQKFREAPADALRECCIEAFALRHKCLLPCRGGGVAFGIEGADGA